MNSSRLYQHPYLNLLPSNDGFIDSRFTVPIKNPLRFIVNATNSNNFGFSGTSKPTDNERLALLERFRAEGLDVRKLNDAQKLPFVWRWLGDAEINCRSLRHQIEKMRMQHDEEIQEVEDYIEQVWKLSTERLLMLEEENKCLREKSISTRSSTNNGSQNNNNNFANDDIEVTRGVDDDDDNDDDSDIELEKCLFGTRFGRNQSTRRDNALSISTTIGNAVESRNLCDSLKLRSSQSNGQLAVAATNGSALNDNGATKNNCTRNGGDNVSRRPDISAVIGKTKTSTINPVQNDNYCEKCQILNAELSDCQRRYAELESTLDDANEKNLVLNKLNRSLEIENENFAYKLAETEDRSHQLERRILLLDRERRQMKSTLPSIASAPVTSSSNNNLVNANNNNNNLNDQSTRRLIDELNHKVKALEEALDHRVQQYEELEMKYEKQKVKQHETLWKLRNFIHDPNQSTKTTGTSKAAAVDQISPTNFDDLPDLRRFLMTDGSQYDQEDNKKIILSSNDSGMATLDSIEHHQHQNNNRNHQNDHQLRPRTH